MKLRTEACCSICTEPAEATCDWLALRQVMANTETAEVGDVWMARNARKRARIVEIVELESDTRQIWVLIPGHPKPYPYIRYAGAGFVTERMARCSVPVCEHHMRELGPEKHVCASHWDAWEVAA